MDFETELNILIINAHWNNRGDEAAIRAMIDSFKSRLLINKTEIMLLSNKVNQFPYEDVEKISVYPSGALSYIDSILLLFTYGKLSFTATGKQYLKAVSRSDMIIHAPGGPSIGDMYGGIVRDYPYLCRLLIGVMKNKPIYFYSPSMGPFKNKYLNIIRKFIFKNSKLIIVREKISAKYLKEQLNIDSYATVDSAFQNEIPENYLSKYSNISEILTIFETKPIIGITITDLRWHPIHKNNLKLREKITNAIANTIEFLTNKGYNILLIPQLFGELNDISWLSTFIEKKEGVLILPENIDSYGQQIIISRLFCVIGMRYHSNIFAAKQNVPFISIYYEHKMRGFMERLGLTDCMINIEDISFNQIKSKFLYIEENYNLIKSKILEQNPYLKEESKKTTDLIVKTLKSKQILA